MTNAETKKGIKGFIKNVKAHHWLYIMCIPSILYFILFKYVPMWGILISFQDFNIYKGFLASEWVGFKHFADFFSANNFLPLMGNTLILSFYSILFAFPAPIILAILLNEIKKSWFKRTIQTIVYIPHFVSMVIVASITFMVFSSTGPVNGFITSTGGTAKAFLTEPQYFRALIIGQTIWKESGWGTIVFLAAMSGIDMEQYEAAIVDGAGRFRQIWHITLPAIRGTIIILLILRMGNVLDNGFEQIFLMSNAGNREISDVLDTFVYREGIINGQFSYTTAIGVFKSLIGMVLIFGTNKLANKFGESGIF